ncbi:hypothetical protein [Otariodibacter oris]|uniref:Lipoprotein n=1 Tax=Otariodibacter oris TaxID=1032623 RepID=A0A420XIP7_9PAST|nr:hypothetical protein [Otariodibacter oris]QGM80700.1 hypothetical protein A6A10_04415 [Otariodibacter oris]RKR77139.1 hypothetical protein DES31_0462 [Otariodibacter oris]
MKKYAFLLPTIFILSSCAMPIIEQPRWYKQGISEFETNNYHAECVYNVGMNKVEPHKEIELVKSCMVKAGFRWGIPPKS